jgi:uncharacterized delta-60 repeat protein
MKSIKLIIVTFLIITIKPLSGQDGTLDYNFGEEGVIKVSFSDKNTRGNNLLYLDDGSFILGINSDESYYGSLINRSFYIYKLFPNGEIDTNFGQNGHLYYPNGDNGKSYVCSMTQQSDGKFIVNSTIDGYQKLLRFKQDGIIDLSFGNSGIVDINDESKIALQSDSKIVLAGQYYDGFDNLYYFSRYNIDGTIDDSYGNNGTVQTDVTSYRFDLCRSIKIDTENRVIAVGTSYDEATHRNAVIVRFNEDGTLDGSFGDNGVVITDFNSLSNHGVFNDVNILPSGNIVAGGNMEYSGGTGGMGGSKPAIVKFNSNGTLDTSFGNQGIVIMNTIYDANDNLWTLTIQSPDQKIIFGGGASLPFPYMQTDFYISRLNSDGSVDTEFGNSGVFLSQFGNAETNMVHDICLDNKGKILAIGITKDPTNQFFNAIVCRLNNESLIIDSHQAKPEINIFPNPAIDYFTVDNLNDDSRITLHIMDYLGKTIQRYERIKNKANVNIANLPPGIYIVVARNEDQIIGSAKFIKQ